MDFANPVNSTGALPERRGSRLKRLAGWCAGIFTGLILLLLALPTLLSNGTVLSWMLSRVNASIAPATVKAESISLAWFREQTLTGIRYTDPVRGIDATVKEVRFSSLRHLLPVRKITVDCTVDTPEIALSAPHPLPGIPLPESPGTEAGVPTATRQILLPVWDIALNLTVQKGRLSHETLPEPLLSDLSCTIAIPERSAAPTITLNTALLDGTLSARTTLAPPETLLTATAPAAMFSSAELTFAAEWAQLDLTVNPLPARAYPGGTLTLSVPCDKLLKRLRSLNLPLPENVKGLSGTLALTGRLEAAAKAEEYRLSTSLQTQNLTGMIDGKRLTLSPSLNLIAEFDPKKCIEGRVERLSIDLPGVMASGSGSLRSGTLAARAEINTLLSTLAPFIGEIPLTEPVVLNLSAAATPSTLKLTATAKSNPTNLATLTVNGDGVNLAERSFASLKTTLQADLAQLAPLFPLPTGQSLSGTLYLNTSAFGSLNAWQAKGVAALRSVVFDSAGWHVEEPSLLEGSASCSFSEKNGLAWSGISLTAPFITAIGEFAKNNLTLAGTLNPQQVLTYRKKPAEIRVTGEPKWELTATLGATTDLEVAVTADPFAITLPDGMPLALPVTAKAAGTASAEEVTLSSYTLTTPYLDLNGKGTFTVETKRLVTSGLFTPDLTQLWNLPFCAPCREAGFALSGRHSNPYSFDLPLGDGLAGILNYGTGEATVVFDKITVPGLNIPNGRATVTLRDAVAAMDGNFSVNNGTVSLQPRLNLAEKPMRLSWPEKRHIFKDISLSQELLDACLKKINPLLTGTVVPGGSVELFCDTLTFTLDDPLASLDARLTFKTRHCAFDPTGNLNILINLLRLTRRTITLPDQDFTIAIEQGILACDTIEFTLPPATLQCSGSTNLKTGEVNYLVQLPLTEQLLGRRLSKYLTGDRLLELPVSGTTHKPILNTGPLLNLLRDSAVSIGIGKLTSRAGKILEKAGGIGLEVGGAAGDTIETGGEIGADAVEALDDVLKNLFKRKKK